MDFWAQHKDFVLKVLAGFGVYLVALIARNITYGDELESAKAQNMRLASEVQRKKLIEMRVVRILDENARKLAANARTLAAEMGWDAGDPDLVLTLIRRTLSYLPEYRDADAATLESEARLKLSAIRTNLDGGFGELRLLVRDEIVDEANLRNITVDGEGIGFENVVDLEPGDLLQYLIQLEMVSRMCSYAIAARVDAIEEIRIETRRNVEVIPGSNPDFLREFPVQFRLRCRQEAMYTILNRLESERPAVPWRALRLDRADRPRDHVTLQVTLLALAADTEIPFAAPREESQ